MSDINVGTTGTYEWSGGSTLDVNGSFAEDLFKEAEEAVAALSTNDDGQYSADSHAADQLGDVKRLLNTAVHLENLGDPNELGADGAEYFANLANLISRQQDLSVDGQGNANEMRDLLVSLNEALLRGEGIDPSAPGIDPSPPSTDGSAPIMDDFGDSVSTPGRTAVDQGLVEEAGRKLDQVAGTENTSDAAALLVEAIDALIAALGGEPSAPPSDSEASPEAVVADFKAAVGQIQAKVAGRGEGSEAIEGEAFHELVSLYRELQFESGSIFTADMPRDIDDVMDRIVGLVGSALAGEAGNLSGEEAISALKNSLDDLQAIELPRDRLFDPEPSPRGAALDQLDEIMDVIEQQTADLAGTGRAPEMPALQALVDAYQTLAQESGTDTSEAPRTMDALAELIAEMVEAAGGEDGGLSEERATEIVTDLVEQLQGISLDAIQIYKPVERMPTEEIPGVDVWPDDPIGIGEDARSGIDEYEPPEMAIATQRYEGDDLVALASGGNITLEAEDGGVGISDQGDWDEVDRDEILTITLPDSAQAGSVSFVDSSENTEISVVARDEQGEVVGNFDVRGDEDGNVVLDIDIPFASLEMTATEGSFAVSSVSAQTLEPVNASDGGSEPATPGGDEVVDFDSAVLIRLLQAAAEMAREIAENQGDGGELVESGPVDIRDITPLIEQLQAALEKNGEDGDGVSRGELVGILTNARAISADLENAAGSDPDTEAPVYQLALGIADLTDELRD